MGLVQVREAVSDKRGVLWWLNLMETFPEAMGIVQSSLIMVIIVFVMIIIIRSGRRYLAWEGKYQW